MAHKFLGELKKPEPVPTLPIYPGSGPVLPDHFKLPLDPRFKVDFGQVPNREVSELSDWKQNMIVRLKNMDENCLAITGLNATHSIRDPSGVIDLESLITYLKSSKLARNNYGNFVYGSEDLMRPEDPHASPPEKRDFASIYAMYPSLARLDTFSKNFARGRDFMNFDMVDLVTELNALLLILKRLLGTIANVFRELEDYMSLYSKHPNNPSLFGSNILNR